MEKPRELPVTEQSNGITRDIDVASNHDVVRLLYEADKQLFNFYSSDGQETQGILTDVVDAVMEKIVAVVGDILISCADDCSIVLSGCGTSGRLAFIIARTFNRKLSAVGRRPIFHYLIAGDDEALLLSKELTEDNPNVGMMDLEKLTRNHSKILYIGITCGLSAAYVAGQLDFCLGNLDRFTPVLIGFNPVGSARDIAIENWNKTFLQVAQAMSVMEKAGKAFILNPIIGAEPITGSTRMKCGSATKILLETMFSCAYLRFLTNADCSVLKLIKSYQVIESVTFEQVENLAALISIGGQCLNAEGHIYYLSDGDLGIIGLVDASECMPTFGADVNDVRGFIVGGFAALGNKEGDLSHVRNISLEYFEAEVLPSLTKNDFLIFLSSTGDCNWISQNILETKALKALLLFTDSSSSQIISDCFRRHLAVFHSVLLPSDLKTEFCSEQFKEIACKWTCNVISTGAHILKGKVYENFMIDVKVSNNKLFHRAVSLVEKFGECSKEEATITLLKSIHNRDTLTEEQLKLPISEHIKVATNGQKVVSTAIIIARQKCQVAEAKKLLSAHPVIRNAMASCFVHVQL